MKRINFLTSIVSNNTGGMIYDSRMINIIKSIDGNKINIIQDKDLLPEGQSKNFINFNKIYMKNYDLLTDCDILIINSRLYTRFILPIITGKFIKRKFKLILIHHHYEHMSIKGIKGTVHKYLEIKFLKLADDIIIPNKYVVDYTKNTTDINGNIIFLESSFKENISSHTDYKNNRILFVGSLEKRKGILYGIKAFELFYKNNPKYELILAGNTNTDQNYYEMLKRYISKSNIKNNVRFTGRISQDELDQLYTTSDLLLFPSLNEGYGWVMIEAMSHGLPVIAFNNTAMPYTVKDGENGFLVENKNHVSMSKKLEKTLSNLNLLKHLGNNAIKTYERVPKLRTLEKNTRKYLESILN